LGVKINEACGRASRGSGQARARVSRGGHTCQCVCRGDPRLQPAAMARAARVAAARRRCAGAQAERRTWCEEEEDGGAEAECLGRKK
jgi:hypothetical protein